MMKGLFGSRFVDVSVHSQMAPRQGIMAEGKIEEEQLMIGFHGGESERKRERDRHRER